MPNPKPTFDKIKIIIKCDQSWENTLNPTDPTFQDTPKGYLIIIGESEILGYLEACLDFKVINQQEYNELIEKYHTQAKDAIANL